MQSDMAVLSMTSSRRFSVSIYDSLSNLTASGLVMGSESYTPSTLVALITTSAPISMARKAAAVSVEK